jgi:hypothetical protein
MILKNQINLKLFWSKQDLFKLKIFEIKYGCEGFEERNNFLHMNFSRFKMNLRWKIQRSF